MLLVLLFVIIAAGCIAADLPSLKGRAKRRDLMVYGVLWIGGMAATVCTLLRFQVPSPLLLLMVIYKPINDLVASWF
ncbi:hypothetical protein [Paenibacillus sp. IHB B 3415]|uniref:hypothetical protein n=1 Tax=Paenibacillus sp. IHB B 3415 TaxID=867080 RepID=UPI000A46A084|nr:hypothetical protein [Paenibacillus sp. IHB B 3415]